MSQIAYNKLVYLYAGKFLHWNDQDSELNAPNGEPVSNTSGIEIVDFQFAKVIVKPQGGATVSFRLWFQYEGLSQFFVVDGSERSGISSAWTQELNIVGVERVYVEILSIDSGTVNISVAQAESKEILVGFKRIGRWEEAGTGDQDGDVLVYTDTNGDQALYRWDGTESYWELLFTEIYYDDLPNLWTPKDITTSLWFDFADSPTVTLVADKISQVNDKSGNGRNATQATDGDRFRYSGKTSEKAFALPDDASGYTTFMSTGDHEVHSNVDGFTVFVVARSYGSALDTFVAKYNHSTGSRGWMLQSSTFSLMEDAGSYSSTYEASLSLDTDVNIVMGTWQPGSVHEAWVNAQLAGTSSSAVTDITDTTEPIHLGMNGGGGGQDYHKGSLHEVICVPAAVSTVVREKLEGYLAHKWNLTDRLPVAHPYKSAAPQK